MKRVWSLILALAMCLSLFACGTDDQPVDTTTPAANATTPPTTPNTPDTDTTEKYETVKITTENWHKYFERAVLKAEFKQTDAWGEVTEWTQEREVLKLRDEYAKRVNWPLCNVAVRYVCDDETIDFIMESSTTYKKIEINVDSRTAEIGEYQWYGIGESPDEGPGWDPWNETAEIVKVRGTLTLYIKK